MMATQHKVAPSSRRTQGYKVGLTASQVVRLIGLLLVFTSQKNSP